MSLEILIKILKICEQSLCTFWKKQCIYYICHAYEQDFDWSWKWLGSSCFRCQCSVKTANLLLVITGKILSVVRKLVLPVSFCLNTSLVYYGLLPFYRCLHLLLDFSVFILNLKNRKCFVEILSTKYFPQTVFKFLLRWAKAKLAAVRRNSELFFFI